MQFLGAVQLRRRKIHISRKEIHESRGEIGKANFKSPSFWRPSRSKRALFAVNKRHYLLRAFLHGGGADEWEPSSSFRPSSACSGEANDDGDFDIQCFDRLSISLPLRRRA
jgi:hypothetical protein